MPCSIDCFTPTLNPFPQFAMTIPLFVIARRLLQPTKQSFLLFIHFKSLMPCSIDCFTPTLNPFPQFAMTIPLVVIARRLFQPK
ncbi:hypothetical protein CBW18_15205, partial [Pedobacter sp. AJM]